MQKHPIPITIITILIAFLSRNTVVVIGFSPSVVVPRQQQHHHHHHRRTRSIPNSSSETTDFKPLFSTIENEFPSFQQSRRRRRLKNPIPSNSLFHLFSSQTQPHPSTTTTTTALLMCQLLGMNCATPTDFLFSFKGFTRRGGDTDKHSDGWGLAFYEGRGIRTFHDPLPAAHSPIAEFMAQYPIKTLNMMAHIRYATEGAVCLVNVHPFEREMWGISWCFAHNGDVPLFSGADEVPWLGGGEPKERIYNPVGDTDSESIFCAILNALKTKFVTLPTMPILYDTIEDLCREIVQSDDEAILNILLMCGEHVQFAYSWPGSRAGSKVWNGLYYTIRKPPFRQAHLSDCDLMVDFAEVTTEHDRVAVIATAPLTDNEEWVEFEKGQLILFDDGLPHGTADDCNYCEFQGHGLKSKVLPSSVFMGSDI